MDLAADLRLDPLRCARFHAATGADPIGSAGAHDAFLCVEVPLPWSADIAAEEPFASLGAGPTLTGADGRVWRPQGLVPVEAPSERSATRPTRVLAFDADGPGPYRRRSWTVPAGDVVALARAVLDDDAAGLAGFGDGADADGPAVDLLVCTHGSRDVCCGGSGTTLFEEASEQLADDVAAGAVRVWRTSHTGGHRFAPTALSFPDGYAWAHLSPEVTAALVRRSGEAVPDAVLSLCRGASSVVGAPAQAADRAALGEFGWAWARNRRRITVVGFDRVTQDTTLEARGAPGSLRVVVGIERHIPRPTCGAVEGPEYETDPVWVVRDLQRLDAAGDGGAQ